jgi:hypothetical protein
MSSAVEFTNNLYSASVLECETVACLRALYDIKLGPKTIAKQPVKRVASRQPAKSAFKKTIRSVGDDC